MMVSPPPPAADFLNGTAFAPVKNDMSGNIKVFLLGGCEVVDLLILGKKIRERYHTKPDAYKTLQAIVQDEAKLPQKQRLATEGLLWLNRYFAGGGGGGSIPFTPTTPSSTLYPTADPIPASDIPISDY